MDDEVYLELEASEQQPVIATETVVVTEYTNCAKDVLKAAEDAAATAPGGVLTCEHLLMSLAGDDRCAGARVLKECGFTCEVITRTITFISGGGLSATERAEAVVLSPRVERVITGAGTEAGNRNAERIDTLHLLYALLRERQGIAAAALETPGVGLEPIGAALSNAIRNGLTDPS